MSLESVAKQFVELCSQGKNFDVMHNLYAPDIVSVEGNGSETAGQAEVIKKSERWAAANTIHGEMVRGPYFNGPAEFASISPSRLRARIPASARPSKKLPFTP